MNKTFLRRRLLWMLTENGRWFSFNPLNYEWKQGDGLAKDEWAGIFNLTIDDLSPEEQTAVIEYCLEENI